MLIGFQKAAGIIHDASVTSRRKFLIGAGAALIVAPSIVRATSLMDIRGVPLTPLLDRIPCDGRILGETDDPEMFGIIESERRAISQIIDGRLVETAHRRYGGSIEERTFAMPDFRGYQEYFGEDKSFELDRQGRLFIVDVAGNSEEI